MGYFLQTFRADGSMGMVLETERPPKRVIVMWEVDEGARIGIETTDYKQEYLPPPVQEALRTMLLVLAASNPFRIHADVVSFCNEHFMAPYNTLNAFKSVGDKALAQHQNSGTDIYDAWETSNSDGDEGEL
jgi:hypothetical protein